MLHLHQPYRLPGQQYDKESGLYYNRNRYYDPLQGRYITQDPIGLEGGWSLYAYPLKPVNGIDPLGLSPADVALMRKKEQLNHQRAWDILSDTYDDMKRLNLGGTDAGDAGSLHSAGCPTHHTPRSTQCFHPHPSAPALFTM